MSETTRKLMENFKVQFLIHQKKQKPDHFEEQKMFLGEHPQALPDYPIQNTSNFEKEKPRKKVDGFMIAIWILLFAPILLLVMLELYRFLESALNFLP